MPHLLARIRPRSLPSPRPGTETGIRFVTASADAFHAHLTAAGADSGEVLRWPGVPAMFAFRDPDGNGMEIVEQA
jgi:catechol 2,3-dioxygenase-like lactoylglutathione lyase family enzyme